MSAKVHCHGHGCSFNAENLCLFTVGPNFRVVKKHMNLYFCFAVYIAMASTAVAQGLNISGTSEIFDNPFVTTGFNKANGVLSGSISAIRTAPGETNECRILFVGEKNSPNRLKTRYFVVGADDGVENLSKIDYATVIHEASGLKLKFNKKNLGGGCDWLLNFVNAPFIEEQGSDVKILVPKLKIADWIGVHTIQSKRAKFYKAPDAAAFEKAFLVAGDTIYVYDEKPGWYYVKFQARSRQTVGWIKVADTVQF